MKQWLLRHRTSVRYAFILRVAALVLGSVAGLLWTRLLLDAMGTVLYGVFLSFVAVSRLGGLGEFGLTGTVGLRAGQLLGRGDSEELKKLLATSRVIFGSLAIGLLAVFVLTSTEMPGWLGFTSNVQTGSLAILFCFAGIGAAIAVISGYFSSLNYAHGTVTWPILPTMVLMQLLAPWAHWMIAKSGGPLWLQYSPYLVFGVANAVVIRQLLKWSHPFLGNLWPFGWEKGIANLLFSTGGWMYLASVGGAIYQTVDRLVINAFLGPEKVPGYQINYKLCELSLVVITTASFVAIPKITQWLAAIPCPEEKLRQEIFRLRAFQTSLSMAAALGYLWINNLFVKWWVGPGFEADLQLMAAFALALVVSGCGECGSAVAARCGRQGIRNYGLAIGATGLINLALSYLAAKSGWLAGIAFATAASQGVLVILMNILANRHLKIRIHEWFLRIFILPILLLGAAVALRALLPFTGLTQLSILAAAYFVLWLAASFSAGLTWKVVIQELSFFKNMVGKK